MDIIVQCSSDVLGSRSSRSLRDLGNTSCLYLVNTSQLFRLCIPLYDVLETSFISWSWKWASVSEVKHVIVILSLGYTITGAAANLTVSH